MGRVIEASYGTAEDAYHVTTKCVSGAASRSAPGSLETVLPSLTIRPKGLNEPALTLGYKNRPAVDTTECQVCGFRPLQDDILLKRGVRLHHGNHAFSDSCNQQFTVDIGPQAVNGVRLERLQKPG